MAIMEAASWLPITIDSASQNVIESLQSNHTTSKVALRSREILNKLSTVSEMPVVCVLGCRNNLEKFGSDKRPRKGTVITMENSA